MNDITEDPYAEIKKLSESEYYFAYLRFENEELVASITQDDFIAYVDNNNGEWVSTLSDTLETPLSDFNMAEYLNGYDYTLPATMHDGSPHPFAGEVRRDEGMTPWFTTIVSNDVISAAAWLRENNMTDWTAKYYDSPAVTYEAIQQELIKQLKEYAAPDIDGSDGVDYGSRAEAIEILQRLGAKGVDV